MADGSGRQFVAGTDGESLPTRDSPDLHRRSRDGPGTGPGKKALRHSAPRREPGSSLEHSPERDVLRGQPLLPDRGVQGDAPGRPDDQLLPGPGGADTRDGTGHGPFPLQHQHLSQLEPGPSLPLPLPQRGDQHAEGQRQLDAGSRSPVRIGSAGTRSGEGAAGHRSGRQRLGHVRQRPRDALHDRADPAPFHDDDDSGALERGPGHESGEAGLLRVPLLPDGTLGRARLHRLHRRPSRRRRAGPQRAASLPLLGHHGRTGRPGLRGGGAGRPARKGPPEGTPSARPHVPGGRGSGTHHLGRRTQAGRLGGPALPQMAPGKPGASGSLPTGTPSPGPGPGAAPAATTPLRLHQRGLAAAHRSHGLGRARGRGLHGNRHAAGSAVGPAPASLQLFQAALRPGDQSSRGRHPGGLDHVPGHPPGIGREPAGPRTPIGSPDPAGLAHPGRRPDGEAAPARRRRSRRVQDHRSAGFSQGRGRGPGAVHGPSLPVRRGGGLVGQRHPGPLGPGRRPRRGSDSGPAGGLGRSPPPDPGRAENAGLPGGGEWRTAGGAPLFPAHRLRRRRRASLSGPGDHPGHDPGRDRAGPVV